MPRRRRSGHWLSAVEMPLRVGLLGRGTVGAGTGLPTCCPGGNAGAAAIQAELARCNVPCAVVGVPKSIDNDILLIDKCFGYDTAVEEAQRALISAKVEASSAFRGVGIVKLMGRQSGFIAVNASMASGMVDIVRFYLFLLLWR